MDGGYNTLVTAPARRAHTWRAALSRRVAVRTWPSWPVTSRWPGEGGAITVAVDFGLIIAAIAAVVTGAVVLWFHLIFVLLVIAALMFPFRQFAVRTAFWSLVCTGLVVWAIRERNMPQEELIELPILTFILVLVFLVAQARARSHEALKRSRRDIEARALLEREAMQDQLEQSQRLDVLGRASTKIAHEMRNLLTVVRGCAAEFADEPDPTLQRRGDEVLGAVDRGIEMLDELVVAGRSTRSYNETLDLTTALQRVEPLLSHLVRSGVRLRLNVPTEPVEARLDRTGFMQIVMNLVTNSVDAIEGDGTIEVAVRVATRHRAAVDGPERVAIISVTDSGAGLPELHDGDVFAPGYTTKEGVHSGLGLPTVWRIAARAGGTVELDSTPGRGTTANVVVPLASTPDRSRRCVLGLTDVRSREMLANELTELGYEVEDAIDGEKHWEIPIDLAVVDADHEQDGSFGARCRRIVRLGPDGPWRRPRSPVEATRLVRQIMSDTHPIVAAVD
jgi:signal transduction histidine kinase